MRDPFVLEPTYRFLLDEDVKSLLPLFPKKRVKTLAMLGLHADMRDDKVVIEAWKRGYIIVTANNRDFNRAVEKFLSHGPKRECRCLWGLVLLPNGQAVQQRLLKNLNDLESRLRLDGKRTTWKEVHQSHLRVSVQRGGVLSVSRLRRCTYHQEQSKTA